MQHATTTCFFYERTRSELGTAFDLLERDVGAGVGGDRREVLERILHVVHVTVIE